MLAFLMLQSGADWVALAGDIAAIATLGVALIALRIWRKELRAHAEHEAALNCLTAVRQLSAAIASYRNPFRHMSEITLGVSQGELERRVLKTRGEFSLEPALLNFRNCEIVASILWEPEIADRMKALANCIKELAHETDEYLRRLSGERRHEIEHVFFKQAEAVIKVPPKSDGPDLFGERLAKAAEGLEEFLKPKVATYLSK